MLRRAALISAVVLLVALAVLFTALNRQRFDVDLVASTITVSSGLALLIAFAAGLLAGALARSHWIALLLAERGRLRNALRLAEARAAELPGTTGSSGTAGSIGAAGSPGAGGSTGQAPTAAAPEAG